MAILRPEVLVFIRKISRVQVGARRLVATAFIAGKFASKFGAVQGHLNRAAGDAAHGRAKEQLESAKAPDTPPRFTATSAPMIDLQSINGEAVVSMTDGANLDSWLLAMASSA